MTACRIFGEINMESSEESTIGKHLAPFSHSVKLGSGVIIKKIVRSLLKHHKRHGCV